MYEHENDYVIPYIGNNSPGEVLDQVKEIAYKTGKVKKGTQIYQDSLKDTVLYIKKGRLKFVMSNYGAEKLLFYLEENTFTLSMMIEAFSKTINVRIIAIEDCEVLYIKENDYLQYLMENKNMFTDFIQSVSKRFAIVSANLMDSLSDTSRGRVYKFIHKMALKNGTADDNGNIFIKNFPTRSDISSNTGIHITNIAKYLTELEKINVIKKVKRDILLKDIDKLKCLIDEEFEKRIMG